MKVGQECEHGAAGSQFIMYETRESSPLSTNTVLTSVLAQNNTSYYGR